MLVGAVTLERQLHLTADRDAVALGRWSLQAGGSGEFCGVKLVNVAGGLQGQSQNDVTPPTLRAWVSAPSRRCMVLV